MYYVCVSNRPEQGGGTFYTADTAEQAVEHVDKLINFGVDKAEIIVFAVDTENTWDADSIRDHAAGKC